MRGSARLPTFVAGLGAVLGLVGVGAGVGCGDEPICQSDVFIAVQTAQVVSDVDRAAPGIQADIAVRTSAAAGELIRLEVVNPDGVVATRLEAIVDGRGNAVFPAVPVFAPRTKLRASVDTFCGFTSNEVTVDVLAASGCEVALVPAPENNPFYAPLGVLSTTSDPDPATPGYQTTASVTTRPGWTVELLRSTATGDELVASTTATAEGIASFARTLGDGLVVLRAICRGPDEPVASLGLTVLVDTTRPICRFTTPFAGSTITPRFDTNANLADGVQLALAAEVSGIDVEGEPTTLVYQATANGAPVSATTTAVSANGRTTAVASLMPATTPASFAFKLGARDHAGNTCEATETYDVSYDACDLAVVAPVVAINRDANTVAGDGSQIDITLAASSGCVGRTVTATCGSNSSTGVVQANGGAALRATICSSSPCESEATCTFTVTNAAALTTETTAAFRFDDQAPTVFLELVAPVLACGSSVTAASDIDPATDGVQLTARVTASGATSRFLEVANAAGSFTQGVSGDHVFTVVPGLNRIIGSAVDAVGNRGTSATCNVTLAN